MVRKKDKVFRIIIVLILLISSVQGFAQIQRAKRGFLIKKIVLDSAESYTDFGLVIPSRKSMKYWKSLSASGKCTKVAYSDTAKLVYNPVFMNDLLISANAKIDFLLSPKLKVDNMKQQGVYVLVREIEDIQYFEYLTSSSEGFLAQLSTPIEFKATFTSDSENPIFYIEKRIPYRLPQPFYVLVEFKSKEYDEIRKFFGE